MFIHAETALLPTRWANNVRIEIADGKVMSVAPDVEAVAGDDRHAVLVPAMPNLHSHAFHRAAPPCRPWRAERRGCEGSAWWSGAVPRKTVSGAGAR